MKFLNNEWAADNRLQKVGVRTPISLGSLHLYVKKGQWHFDKPAKSLTKYDDRILLLP